MENELLKSVHKIYEAERTGSVYAADDVFVTVVGMATTDVEGLLGLSDLNTGELCTRPTVKNLSKCIRFDFTDNQITVLIGVIMISGSNLLNVSSVIQNKVFMAVKDIVGCEINKVNIQISDVRTK